ncbi:MAG: sugar ABC transporter ATP-binding protein [Planctomycetota bacterium]
MSEAKPCRLSVHGISKRFAGVTALDDVSLEFAAGEVHAVIGENGAGKSTLMKILAGVQPPSEGEVHLEGKRVSLDSVQVALHNGIALIHQELNLADNLPVGANIFLGREPTRFGKIDFKAIREQSKPFLKMVGLELDPDQPLGELAIGVKQLVEIAKALSTNASVIIMDEPTSSLSAREADRLMKVVEELRGRGVMVIYISHRLGEVQRLADRVSVLRDGKYVTTMNRESVNRDAMVRAMVGRDIETPPPRKRDASPVCFRVSEVVTPHPIHQREPISLNVAEGEIVAIAGLVGAGRSELLQTIFGITPKISGEIEIEGQKIAIETVRDAIEHRLALVPEDRKESGLVLAWGTKPNASLAALHQSQRRFGLLNFAVESKQSDEAITRMRIKTSSSTQPVETLSGGNQQKVVIGKWMATKPKVLMLDEPTRGVDVGAKQEIYDLIRELAESGAAILVVSSELEEVMLLGDRVIVMHEGKITGTLDRDEATEESIMHLATNSVGHASHDT